MYGDQLLLIKTLTNDTLYIFIKRLITIQASIFEKVSTGFMRMLSLKLRNQHYLPNQTVFERGEIGYCMIIIQRGELEVSYLM